MQPRVVLLRDRRRDRAMHVHSQVVSSRLMDSGLRFHQEGEGMWQRGDKDGNFELKHPTVLPGICLPTGDPVTDSVRMWPLALWAVRCAGACHLRSRYRVINTDISQPRRDTHTHTHTPDTAGVWGANSKGGKGKSVCVF